MAEHGGFDEVVARLDAAMVVVTVATPHEVDGCLVGFHGQASIDPPRYAVWLSRANRTFRLASEGATHLAVHALTSEDHDVAERFGGRTGDEVDKLADESWAPGPGGVPVLDRLPTRIVGRIVERIDLADADHVAFVLEPVVAALGPAAAPLRLSGTHDIDPGHSA